jgi:hypothetical protein
MILHHSSPRERDAEQFLKLLHHSLGGDQRIEIRHMPPGGGGPMRRTFFSDPVEAAEYAVSLVRDGVYASVAPRRGEVGTRAGITRLLVLWADLDAKGDHTCESRLSQLMDLAHHPSMVVSTGAGLHAYWLLRTPAEGPEELELAELTMRRIALVLDGDPVHDRSRVMRIPGSYNHKYGAPRLVKTEHFDPSLRHELDELRQMAASLPNGSSDGAVGVGKVRRDILGTPIREGQRNVTLASVAGSLRDRGLDAEAVCVVLLELNRLRCEPPLGEQEVIAVGRSVSKYAAGSPRYGSSSARRVYRKEVC